jgi:zinc-binding alcohol dehydrogenase/oxidoreductase
MKAIIYHSEYPDKISLENIERPSRSEDQCLVKVNAAALNRRDQWIREGLYPGIRDQVILGSDGCGIVEEGPVHWRGKEVIINPNINWGVDARAQSLDYHILGMPTNGTLAEYVVVSEDRLISKPKHLSAQQAAALPLAGLTAFRACFTKGKITKNDKVLISGIGGGVSQFAMQFCLSVDARVFVNSSNDEKLDQAVKNGARKGFNYTSDFWIEEAAQSGPFDVIIDSAGGASLNDYIKLIKPGGKIVMYGSTNGRTPQLDTARLFWSQAQVIGSTMGNDQEFAEMVALVERHKLVPVIDQVYSHVAYLSAFGRFKSPSHLGKIVLTF